MFPAKEDDLEVKRGPFVFGEYFFQIRLGFHHVLAGGKSPAIRQAVNVSVYGKGWFAKRLRHYN